MSDIRKYPPGEYSGKIADALENYISAVKFELDAYHIKMDWAISEWVKDIESTQGLATDKELIDVAQSVVRLNKNLFEHGSSNLCIAKFQLSGMEFIISDIVTMIVNEPDYGTLLDDFARLHQRLHFGKVEHKMIWGDMVVTWHPDNGYMGIYSNEPITPRSFKDIL